MAEYASATVAAAVARDEVVFAVRQFGVPRIVCLMDDLRGIDHLYGLAWPNGEFQQSGHGPMQVARLSALLLARATGMACVAAANDSNLVSGFVYCFFGDADAQLACGHMEFAPICIARPDGDVQEMFA